MILSYSTLRSIALATLVVSASAASSTIRGSSREEELLQDSQPEDPAHQLRDLIEIDMNIGLGQMVCQEDLTDGSVVCTFRIMPPTNPNTGTILQDCLYSSQGNYCLSSEVYKGPFAQPPQTPQTPPPPPQPVTPVLVGTGGTCPAQRPLTGLGCQQNVPSGLTTTTCLYGDFTCKCNLSKGPAWNCYRVMGQQQPPPPLVVQPPPPSTITVVAPPKPPTPPSNNGSFSAFQCRPVQNGCTTPHTVASDCSGSPACCPGNIIEDWRTAKNTCKHGGFPATIPATINAAETGTETGSIIPTIINDSGCPSTIPLGEPSCDLDFNIKCTYYTGPAGAPTGARDCACLKATGTFFCKTTSSVPGISF